MNHSNETNLKIICSIDRISISQNHLVFLLWVRLCLQNWGRALRLGRLRGRALQLEQVMGPSAAARAGEARGPRAAARVG